MSTEEHPPPTERGVAPPPHKHAKAESVPRLVEEIVDEVVTQRAESTETEQQQSLRRGPGRKRPPPSSSPHTDGARKDVAPSGVSYCPENTVQFVPGTLATSHPHLVLNAGSGEREMRFRGVWDPAETFSGSQAQTNRAVIKVVPQTTQGASGSLKRRTIPTLSASVSLAAAAEESSAVGVDTVQSLLPHAREGLTADERREELERERRAWKWQYEEVVVPTAVLVMHRYK